MVPLVLLFFSVPLIMFSMTGGFLADRFSKRRVIIWTKLIEIAAMAAGIIALSTGLLSFATGSAVRGSYAGRAVWAFQIWSAA